MPTLIMEKEREELVTGIGFPEENQIHGIYCIKGKDAAFSERKPNMNMRTFLPEYYNKLVQKIYP